MDKSRHSWYFKNGHPPWIGSPGQFVNPCYWGWLVTTVHIGIWQVKLWSCRQIGRKLVVAGDQHHELTIECINISWTFNAEGYGLQFLVVLGNAQLVHEDHHRSSGDEPSQTLPETFHSSAVISMHQFHSKTFFAGIVHLWNVMDGYDLHWCIAACAFLKCQPLQTSGISCRSA